MRKKSGDQSFISKYNITATGHFCCRPFDITTARAVVLLVHVTAALAFTFPFLPSFLYMASEWQLAHSHQSQPFSAETREEQQGKCDADKKVVPNSKATMDRATFRLLAVVAAAIIMFVSSSSSSSAAAAADEISTGHHGLIPIMKKALPPDRESFLLNDWASQLVPIIPETTSKTSFLPSSTLLLSIASS
jgi:hypothetical protein